jgi:hypothetical protein
MENQQRLIFWIFPLSPAIFSHNIILAEWDAVYISIGTTKQKIKVMIT